MPITRSQTKKMNPQAERGSNDSFLSLDESLPAEQEMNPQANARGGGSQVINMGGVGGGGKMAGGKSASGGGGGSRYVSSMGGRAGPSGTQAVSKIDRPLRALGLSAESQAALEREWVTYERERERLDRIAIRDGMRASERHSQPRMWTRVKRSSWAVVGWCIRNRLFVVNASQLVLMVINTILFLYAITTYG